jgi:hypothetical protein
MAHAGADEDIVSSIQGLAAVVAKTLCDLYFF